MLTKLVLWYRHRVYVWRKRRFHRLVERWHRENAFKSLLGTECPSYRAIVRMGAPVLPIIFEYLWRQPDWLMPALVQITGQNPCPKHHRGKLHHMTMDWLQWALDNGHVTDSQLRFSFPHPYWLFVYFYRPRQEEETDFWLDGSCNQIHQIAAQRIQFMLGVHPKKEDLV